MKSFIIIDPVVGRVSVIIKRGVYVGATTYISLRFVDITISTTGGTRCEINDEQSFH